MGNCWSKRAAATSKHSEREEEIEMSDRLSDSEDLLLRAHAYSEAATQETSHTIDEDAYAYAYTYESDTHIDAYRTTTTTTETRITTHSDTIDTHIDAYTTRALYETRALSSRPTTNSAPSSAMEAPRAEEEAMPFETESLSAPIVVVEPVLSRQASPPLAPSDETAAVETTPFIEKIQTFECGVEGKAFHFPEHGVAVNIDQDTITEGENVQFEVGVTLYGPFHFSNNKQPISPILWLCMEEEITLRKPMKITLPHCLVDLRDEEIDKYGVTFAKANHNNTKTTPDGKRVFVFEPCTEEDQHFDGSSGYISTNHCCYICIEANNTREVALRSGYCLSVVERPISHTLHTVHVCATFLLLSCSKVLKLQYPREEGYTISSHEFQFNEPETTEQDPRVIVPKPDGWTVAMEPGHGQISLLEIDFWKWELNIEEMKARHDTKIYPPRIKMEVRMANTTRSLLKLCFHGCKSKNGKDITVERILPKDRDGIEDMPSSKKQRFENKHVLSTADIKVVRRATFSIHPEWKDIGIELQVPLYALEGIARNHEDVSDRFREMLIAWLKLVNPKPTWEALVNAMMHVGQEESAESVRQTYCPLHIPL